MVYQIVKNEVKPGARAEYAVVSREFCEAMAAFGALSAKVLFDEADENSVVNITVWKDRAEMDAFMASGIPESFYPRLMPWFMGNETMILTEQL